MLFSFSSLLNKRTMCFGLSKRNVGCIKVLLRTFSFFDIIVTLSSLVFKYRILSFSFKLEIKNSINLSEFI